MSAPSNPLGSIFSSIADVIAPGLANAQAQASVAADQLTLAFETLIAEGAIVIGLLLIQTAILWKYARK